MFRSMKHSRATGAAFVVLLALASFANVDELAWPGLSLLEKRSRKSRPTVVAALKELVQLREIEIVAPGDCARAQARRHRPSTVYRLLVVNPLNHVSGKPADISMVKFPQFGPRLTLFPEHVRSGTSPTAAARKVVSQACTHIVSELIEVAPEAGFNQLMLMACKVLPPGLTEEQLAPWLLKALRDRDRAGSRAKKSAV